MPYVYALWKDIRGCTRLAVIGLAAGCLVGALGGLLSRYPALNSPHQSGRG